MISTLALDTISILVRGGFDPVTINPLWVARRGLLPESDLDRVQVGIVSSELTQFSLEWCEFTVTRDTLQVLCKSPPDFERARDLVVGVLRSLEDSPIAVLGMNRHSHVSVSDLAIWHSIGDRLTPKPVWEQFMSLPGMRSVNIQGIRDDLEAGMIFVKVEPSMEVPLAIYVSYNDHYELQEVDSQPTDRLEIIRTQVEVPVELKQTMQKTSHAIKVLSEGWASFLERSEIAIDSVMASGRSH